MTQKQTNFVDGLTSAARDNPLAAALIGGGALWLLMGGGGARGLASAYTHVVEPAAEAGLRGLREAASSSAESVRSAGGGIDRGWDRASDAVASSAGRVRSAASGVLESVGDRASAVRDTVSDGFDRAASTLGSVPDYLPDVSGHYADARSALSDILERQPLVLGAIGLAIGASLASAVPATRLENEWVGETSDAVKDAVRSRGGEVASAVQQTAAEAANELRSVAGESLDNLKRTGETVVQGVKSAVTEGVR